MILISRWFIFPVLIAAFLPISSIAQKMEKIDSLEKLIAKDKEDTNKVLHLSKLSAYYQQINPDTSIILANEALLLAKKTGMVKQIPVIYTFLGAFHNQKGNYVDALLYYDMAIPIWDSLIMTSPNDESLLKGKAGTIGNKGNVFFMQGDYEATIGLYAQVQEIIEQVGDSTTLAVLLGNMGSIHVNMHNYNDALEYHRKSLVLSLKLNNLENAGSQYANIGVDYMESGLLDSAVFYFKLAYKVDSTINNDYGVAADLSSLGDTYTQKAKQLDDDPSRKSLRNHYLDTALQYLLRSLNMKRELEDASGLVIDYAGLGDIYFNKGDYKTASEYYFNEVALAHELGTLEGLENGYAQLSTLYELSNVPLPDTLNGRLLSGEEMRVRALDFMKLHMLYRDSINATAVQQGLLRNQLQYEFRQQQAIKEEQLKKEQAIADADKQRQSLLLILVGSVALAIAIIAFMIFRSLRVTRGQKLVIEQQKTIVEEKNKDILDSIHYAERIQKALLAHQEVLDRNIPEHFVLYRPKDIVSGDFYYSMEKGDKFYLAVCDSTGHGVPGAFMSLLNISFMNEALNEKQLVSPNEILNYVRQRLVSSISSGNESNQDGMDGILLCIDKRTNKFTYAAAYNAPVKVRNGIAEVLGADKMPIGKSEKTEPFRLHEIDMKAGDTIYLFTDGMADQFGGPRGKKLKYKAFHEILQRFQSHSVQQQRELIGQSFETWKGNLEQVDDVLVVGIRVN